MFSYTDRVPEVSARDFSNILLNFVETAVTLRNKLMPGAAETEPQQQAQQQQPQWWEDEGEEEGVVSEGDECVH